MNRQSALERIQTLSPVRFIPPDREAKGPVPGLALALSGGGYRAMIFHLGALLRLNEAGILGRLTRISSVSGGSITSALLGYKWKKLEFEGGRAARLSQEVIDPIREMGRRTIDWKAVLMGVFLPGGISSCIAGYYDRYLYRGATLQDLPSDAEGPRFVINSTDVKTGVLWRFSRPYMGDYLIGRIAHPKLPLATAVAASSAFPPFLSPAHFKIDPNDFMRDNPGPLQRPPFTTQAVLTDGGVYDNMGLETVWKEYQTVFISDAGSTLSRESHPRTDWLFHAFRAINIIQNQVGSLRKRQVLEAFQNKLDGHNGAYWSVASDIGNYHLKNALPCPENATQRLADIPTRLAAMDDRLQERLINWGYAVCDTAIRKHCLPFLGKKYGLKIKEPKGFSYPGGVG
jgi:NTE family protein